MALSIRAKANDARTLSSRSRRSRSASLRRLAEKVLETADIGGLARLLTQELPPALGVPRATLLLWDRKLESFESLQSGETPAAGRRPVQTGTPGTRYLISDGQILESPGGEGEGALLPLMARSGLVGMVVLGERSGRRPAPYRPWELRLLSLLASRAALAVENQLYQRELIASERMAALGTMAGMLAHDLRGPMTVIRGYAETLLEPDVPGEEVRSRADLIIQMVDRLERMATETLDFARGGTRLARRGVDLSRLLNEMAADLVDELPGLEVVRDFRVPKGARAAVDVDKLRRAVTNIAANALDAMGGRGRFHMSAVLEEAAAANGQARRLVLVLGDEGPGVPEEIRDRVFDPFVTRGKKAGTGLGLAVSRRFIEDHAGTVELLPEGPGARFRITLPLGAAEGRTS